MIIIEIRIIPQLKKYRTYRGCSQAKLASLAGLSQNSISDLENGVYQPTLYNAYKLAEVLQVPVTELFVYYVK